MIDVGSILLTRSFWLARVLTTAISLILVWKGIIMASEVILYTPAEYLPTLLIIGLVVGAIPVMIRAMDKFDDLNKKRLRDGSIIHRMKFGMDYMCADIGVMLVAIIGAILAPGYICDALGVVPTSTLCGLLAFLWAGFVGVCDIKTFGKAIDHFHNLKKIKALEKEAKAKAKAESEDGIQVL